MSLVIAKDHGDYIEVCSDSRGYLGNYKVEADPKLYPDHENNVIFGCSGYDIDSKLFKKWWKGHAQDFYKELPLLDETILRHCMAGFVQWRDSITIQDTKNSQASTYLVATQAGIASMSTDGYSHVELTDGFLAIGCESETADGLLMAGADPLTAMQKIVDRGCIYVSPPFLRYFLSKETGKIAQSSLSSASPTVRLIA